MQYLYHVLKAQSTLPEEGLAMIRYHSFYPYVPPLYNSSSRTNDRPSESCITLRWHREGAYAHLANEKDAKHLAAVKAFNPYDLYSKSDDPVDPVKLRPYYEGLIAKFFPAEIDW